MRDLSTDALLNTSTVRSTYALAADTPRRSELLQVATFGDQHANLQASDGSNLTFNSSPASTGQMKILHAPFPLQITDCWFCFYAGSSGPLPINASNYWIFELRKTLARGATDAGRIVAMDTSGIGATSGFGWTSPLAGDTGYQLFSGVDTSVAVLQTGDMLGFQISRVGTTGSTPLGTLNVTVAYQRV